MRKRTPSELSQLLYWRALTSEVLADRETDLETALRMSREEEARRNRALEDANSRALFDDQNQL